MSKIVSAAFLLLGVVKSQKFVPADGTASELFGLSVSINDNHAAIGAPGFTYNSQTSQGAIYVYYNNNSIWSFVNEIFASDGEAYDYYGFSVSLSGDYIAGGADYHNVGSNMAQGSVYVSYHSGEYWTEQAELVASDGVDYDQFGWAVSIDADIVLIGAIGKTGGFNVFEGAAYVFLRSGTAWSQQAKLMASDGAAFDNFGSAVSLSGDYAAVGAIGDKIGSNSYQGGVYLFLQSGSLWTQTQKLYASDGAANDYFGVSVSMYGSFLAIGADYDDIGSNSNQGSVYMYTLSGSLWYSAVKLVASDGATDDNYGYSVSLSETYLIVGSHGDDVDTSADEGSAYIYAQSSTSDASSWSLISKIAPGDGLDGEHFGFSVASMGNYIVVSAPQDSTTDVGSIYIYSNLNSDESWDLSCPYGTYVSQASCVDCPVGKYNSEIAISACVDCDLGMTTTESGSTSETDCVSSSMPPTANPTSSPSTPSPSNAPTFAPSSPPTSAPSSAPTLAPSWQPSSVPTIAPTIRVTDKTANSAASSTEQVEQSIGLSVGAGCAFLAGIFGFRYYKKRKDRLGKANEIEEPSTELAEMPEEGLTKGIGPKSDEYSTYTKMSD